CAAQTVIAGGANTSPEGAPGRPRLHGNRPTDKLTTRAALELLGHCRAVMREALGAGGTSFDALYVNVNGESGYFERSLNVYGRAGQPCPRCGAPVRRDPFMNRSAFTCPRCQPRPPAQR